ncbi:MAG: translation initiation factor IF-2 [Saprospiraceae bacterium]
MAKRLVQVAKELNVGVSTIVDFLVHNGFEVENKPTAKISDEMEAKLLKEFQKSIAIKEKADSLVIGARPMAKGKEEPATHVSPPPAPKKEEAPVVEKHPKPEPEVEKPAPEKPRLQLRVQGKVDLDALNKPKKAAAEPPAPKEEPKEMPKVEEPEVKAEPIAEKPAEQPAPEPVAEAPKAPQEQIMRAEAPELRGLKILGKIDIESRAPKKKKKEEPPKPAEKKADQPAPAKSSTPGAAETEDQKKRKRKRRKVSATPVSNDGKGQAGGKRGGQGDHGKGPDLHEVSQKEVEEKLKATMALLSGGGKKKRQKLRRESRERIREKQEQFELSTHSDKLMVTEFISVQELANLMNIQATDVITSCLSLGIIVSINQRLDAELIELVAGEFGHEVEFISAEDQTVEVEEEEDDPADLAPRAPIVTVMGHVDHGKTSLLDYIRKTNVAGGEAGGITQHIGAYEVVVGEENRKITFLDTPGHEAFTAMRARGAKVTDIAVVVIAADDSIMPQTREAISHAQAAGVPIVFAINKIDKPGANPDKIKQELASMNLLIEEWGGNYQSQDISAKTGLNIDLLLEKILLAADIQELKANPKRKAIGTILEASLDKGRGYVAKILVQNGTLDIGDPIVAGEHAGKVKAMFNERGQRIQSAGPSTPLLVLGLSGAPQAGERFKETENESDARQLAAKRAQISREQSNRASKRISLEEIGRRLALGSFKELNLIVKGDFDGSVEALSDSLIKLSIESVQVNVIHKGVGQIVESDVLLASASDAIIVGFQVRPSVSARKLAEREGVEIKLYSIIYEAIEEVRSAIEGMLEPTREEKIICNIEVREVYKISKVGTVAGCYVLDGKVMRTTNIRLIRDGIVIFPTKEGVKGELASLKRFKEDTKEVKAGMECGLTIKNFNDIKAGDIIEGYEIIETRQTL